MRDFICGECKKETDIRRYKSQIDCGEYGVIQIDHYASSCCEAWIEDFTGKIYVQAMLHQLLKEECCDEL